MCTSITINVDNSPGKSFGNFLRQIVPDAALDEPVLIFTREFVGM